MSDLSRLEDDAPAHRVLFIGALLLMTIPTLQVVSQLWPLQLVNIQWRFGAANAFSAILVLPFLGMTLLFLLARATGNRALSRVIGVLAGFLTFVILASTVLFILDALQLKTIVQSRMLDQFRSTMMRVIGLSGVFAVAFAVVAVSAFSFPKATGLPQKGASGRKGDDGVGLIVGQSGPRTE